MAYLVCQEMNWSWRDLCEAPADFIEEIAERAALQNKWTETKRKQASTRGGKR